MNVSMWTFVCVLDVTAFACGCVSVHRLFYLHVPSNDLPFSPHYHQRKNMAKTKKDKKVDEPIRNADTLSHSHKIRDY